MSRNRFQLLLRFIRFANNESKEKSDRLYKVRVVIDLIQDTFSSEYQPGATVSIGESMIPFRGDEIVKPLAIIHYNKGKQGVDISDQLR
ncbi:hypothetical protein ILUMI_00759 [Ignelater luminosus]|uniref:PiggyBac transposable element-derived protein domain-containing protein n=1 Tax=Ignelater luminosus TaxID=2038154 RepID=A0A8K0DFN2_IGNLU|nr:hypothetical protein ILUMI_00759 [Ignelater luminosus]